MRLVICDGIQYDAEKLPRGVDASRCMPADEWFAKNRKTKPVPVDEPEPKTMRTKRSRG